MGASTNHNILPFARAIVALVADRRGEAADHAMVAAAEIPCGAGLGRPHRGLS